MEENDNKAWERIIQNSYYPLLGNDKFVLYSPEKASKITEDSKNYIPLLGSNLCGEIFLESKFDKRKRIIKKLLAEYLEN